MKKTISIALSAVMLLTLAGCKATPENDIVKGKNLEKMIDNATKPQATGTNGAAGQSLSEKMGVQKNYVKELVDAKGKVKIHVNADVSVPDSKGVSVQRVQPQMLSQGTVDILRQKLVKGDLFSGSDYKMTKSEIEQKILEVQAAINSGAGNKIKGGKGSSMLEYNLSDLKEKLKTAPETSTKVPSTGKLGPNKDKTIPGEELYGLAQSDKGGYESFYVLNDSKSAVSFIEYTSEKGGFSKHMGYFSTKEEIKQAEDSGSITRLTSKDLEQIKDISITKEGAKQKAEDLLSALGIKDMTCIEEGKVYGGSTEMTADGSAYINPAKCVWFLRFSRNVKGVNVTHTAYDCIKVEMDNQAAPWSYEDMTFAIDDSGIVGFSWHSPYKITGTVTENSNLASFNDTLKVFDTMSLVVNAWDGLAQGNPNLVGVEINVDHIQFGLTRVTEQNKRDSGLLVPAWDFIGTMTYISKVNGETKKMDFGPIPILTINAIDGSIINRSLGY